MCANNIAILNMGINLEDSKISISTNTRQVTQYFKSNILPTNLNKQIIYCFKQNKVDMTLI
jgi:hypothetical protein